MKGKLVIFSAPSGSGKSTIINQLKKRGLEFTFSVSATCRPPRGEEKNGVEYYFLTPEDFKNRLDKGDFLEYQEVYENTYYGTLRSEVDHKLEQGSNMLFDVDVKGGLNIKRCYKERAMALFIQPPSVDTLRQRLLCRNTDSKEMIEKRLAKATYEMNFAAQFDHIIINDNLEQATDEACRLILNFLKA